MELYIYHNSVDKYFSSQTSQATIYFNIKEPASQYSLSKPHLVVDDNFVSWLVQQEKGSLLHPPFDHIGTDLDSARHLWSDR